MAVAIWLRVGDTSAQDISLTSSGVAVLDYPMGALENTPNMAGDIGDRGRTITESLELHISDSTAALAADKLRAIRRLLDFTRFGESATTDFRLYLRIQFDHDSEVWRSQILDYKIETEEGTNQIWRKFVKVTLIVTRRFFWETEALRDVEVTSGTTTTPTTGYATVYNSDDTHATQRNWLHVASTELIGDLPAPAKLFIKNTSGATRDAASFFLGNYTFANPSSVDPIFRSEDAGSSDTTPGATEQNIYTWDLSSNGLVDDFRGQFGRFVVAWSDRPAVTTLVRAAIQYRAPVPEADLALGEQMIVNPSVFVSDLGALPIPPSGWVAGLGTNVSLVLKAKAASGTDTLGVDWLQIFPSGAGLYRAIHGIFASLTLASNNELVDDGSIGATYLLTSGGDELPLYRPLFTPIYLWPGRTQRLRMMVSGGASFEPGNSWGMKLQYRPRRGAI